MRISTYVSAFLSVRLILLSQNLIVVITSIILHINVYINSKINIFLIHIYFLLLSLNFKNYLRDLNLR